MRSSHFRATLAMIGVVTMAAGCAHVSRDDLSAELAQIRQEMREGDEANAATVAQMGQRMTTAEQQIQARLTALEGDLNSLGEEFQVAVERMEASVRFSAPVHFAYDDATVREADHAVLDRFAQVTQEYYEGALIAIEGFADPSGSAAYNEDLARRRAEAVKSYLEQAGIPADRMRAVSYGEAEERQVVRGAAGPGETGWQNRRVALVVDFSATPSVPMTPPPSEGGDR